jgi:uncharacterized membrane protein (Fun14 family)
MTTPTDPSPSTTLRNLVGQQLSTMPSWKRKIMSLALVAGLAGGGVWGYDTLTRPTPTQPVVINSPAAPAGASGFLNTPAATPSSVSQSAPQPAQESTLRETAARWTGKLGLSLFAGLCLGILLRVYLKTIAILAAAATAILVGISYVAPKSVDTEKLKQQTEQVESYATKQGHALYDRAMTSLPSAGTAFFGMILGLKKK